MSGRDRKRVTQKTGYQHIKGRQVVKNARLYNDNYLNDSTLQNTAKSAQHGKKQSLQAISYSKTRPKHDQSTTKAQPKHNQSWAAWYNVILGDSHTSTNIITSTPTNEAGVDILGDETLVIK